ncbi:MAG: hypothetical protein AB7F75_09640 [Planctomycetota bacterium]
MEIVWVKERISVLAAFRPEDDHDGIAGRVRGPCEVLRVRWKQTEYRDLTQTARWLGREGREVIEHITVKTTAGDVLWLTHNRMQGVWVLEKIQVMA